ncbi:MAG: HD domain-containing protein [Peptococcaceae bacterium]|nr:HD domain-containing protein [Peptococcaceae bacterium]
MNIEIPSGATKIIAQLNQAGYEAYIVGGCVRDSLMGKTPSDWDICTSARVEEMLEIFKDQRVIPTGIQHGTLTILQKDGAYEVTTFRIDGEYADHRHPTAVAFTDKLAEDLSRRDFTINAMAWHPECGLIDLFGGVADLRARVVRAVGEPAQRFDEDGLRMLRMVRFATVLDFDYDAQTREAAVAQNHLLAFISKERIQEELNKILLAAHPARGLRDLYDLGMYPYIIPEMCHTVGFAQRGGHHFLDVFEHSILAVGVIDRELILRLTMLLHDIGKPFTWVEKADYDAFDNHAEVGAKIANHILRALKYDNATRKAVVELIAHHNDGIIPDETNIRQNLARLGETQTRRLIKVKVADLTAHYFRQERAEIDAIFQKIERMLDAIIARGDCYQISDLAIGGAELKKMGLEGRAIGDMLHKALDHVVILPEDNNRDFLMRWIQDKMTHV